MLVERGIWPQPWKGEGEVTVEEGRRRSTRETKDCYERRDKDKEKKIKYKRKDKKIGTK